MTYLTYALCASMAAFGATFDIDPQADQPIELTTDANDVVLDIPENPTTGYRWQVAALSPGMRVVNAEFIAPEDDSCCGVPGKARFDIKLNRDFNGTGDVKLVSTRSWNQDDQAQTLVIKITKM